MYLLTEASARVLRAGDPADDREVFCAPIDPEKFNSIALANKKSWFQNFGFRGIENFEKELFVASLIGSDWGRSPHHREIQTGDFRWNKRRWWHTGRNKLSEQFSKSSPSKAETPASGVSSISSSGAPASTDSAEATPSLHAEGKLAELGPKNLIDEAPRRPDHDGVAPLPMKTIRW
jgi:hypothetical protein